MVNYFEEVENKLIESEGIADGIVSRHKTARNTRGSNDQNSQKGPSNNDGKRFPSRPLDSDGKLPTGRIDGHPPTGRTSGDSNQVPPGWPAAQGCKQVAPAITADILQVQGGHLP